MIHAAEILSFPIVVPIKNLTIIKSNGFRNMAVFWANDFDFQSEKKDF